MKKSVDYTRESMRTMRRVCGPENSLWTMKRVYGPYKKSTDHIKESMDNRKESTEAGRTRSTKASPADAGRRQQG